MTAPFRRLNPHLPIFFSPDPLRKPLVWSQLRPWHPGKERGEFVKRWKKGWKTLRRCGQAPWHTPRCRCGVLVLSHSILGFLGLREVPQGWESSGEKGMGSEGTRGGRCAAWGHLGRGLIAPVGGLCTLGGPPWLPLPAPSALTSKVLVSSARGPRPRLWLQPGPGPGSATRRPWVWGVPGAVGSGGGVMVWGAAWCSH